MKIWILLVALCSAPASAEAAPAPCNGSAARAFATAAELRSNFFNPSTGLYNLSLWWESANALEAVSNLVAFESGDDAPPPTAASSAFLRDAMADIATMFQRTQNVSLNVSGNPGPVSTTLSGYFDDEGWWGLAWMRAYEATGKKTAAYVERAARIFDDVAARGWQPGSCGGGVAWNLASWGQFDPSASPAQYGYKNSITNTLFVTLGARLAQHHPDPDRRALYAVWALRGWEWVSGSGVLNARNLVNDGLDTFAGHQDICRNNNQTEWTYNQGVMVGAMTEVWKLTGDVSLLRSAAAVIDATLKHLTWAQSDTAGVGAGAGAGAGAGVLRESCEQDTLRGQPWPFNYASPIGSGTAEGCTPDQLQFKGIFVRYVTYYLQALASNSTAAAAVGGRTAQQRYAAAVARQARSLWDTAACLPSAPVAVGAAVRLPALFGSRWVGPCSGTAGSPSAATQSSALDAMSGDAIVACLQPGA